MQTQFSTHSPLLDPIVVEVITEELILMPDRVPFSVEPSALGAYDAQVGNPCQPYERGYRRLSDCEAYIVAFREVEDALEWERWYAEDTAAYVEAQLDNEFWRWGGN